MERTRSLLIGISGGSCSGKTTFANDIRSYFGEGKCQILLQDHYYFDQSSHFEKDGDVNFDHPDAIDFNLLAENLASIKTGQAIKIPQYDFSTHKRASIPSDFHPTLLTLIDGTLILTNERARALLDYSFFINTSKSVRFERRKKRDTKERGRTLDGVIHQFNLHVQPMHETFVDPSAEFADEILSEPIDLQKVTLKIDNLLSSLNKTV